MAPILDGTADVGSWQTTAALLTVREWFLLAVLITEVVALAVLS